MIDPMCGCIALNMRNMILWLILWVAVFLWASKILYCVGAYESQYSFEQVKYNTVVNPFDVNKLKVKLCWILCVAVFLFISKIWYCVWSYEWLYCFEEVKLWYYVWSYAWVYCFEHEICNTVSDPMGGCIALHK